MAIEIVVPTLGESVIEATVTRWMKKEGDRVEIGDVLLELETEKVNLEVGSEHAGVLTRIVRKANEDVRVGDVLGELEEAGAPPDGAHQVAAETITPIPREAPESEPTTPEPPRAQDQASPAPEAKPPTQAAAIPEKPTATTRHTMESTAQPPLEMQQAEPEPPGDEPPSVEPPFTRSMPVAVTPTPSSSQPAPVSPAAPDNAPDRPAVRSLSDRPPRLTPSAPPRQGVTPAAALHGAAHPALEGEEDRQIERVRMSRRRRTIARNLLEAQQRSAILTTFNEIDMTGLMDLRQRHKESFKARYGFGLGITSFFVKAVIGALKQFPLLNAEVQGDEIVVKHYYDIGVALDTPEGLVVPVLRGADRMTFPEIELTLKDFIRKSGEGGLTLEDLRGGSFTITNGGVYGSMLSTPILNQPEVGILGLHKIEDRPIALEGKVVIHPMMYVALSYDHRIIDGRVAVKFLGTLKELIEDPGALLLEG